MFKKSMKLFILKSKTRFRHDVVCVVLSIPNEWIHYKNCVCDHVSTRIMNGCCLKTGNYLRTPS